MSAESEGEARAATFRADHNLGTQPLTDLVALIEATQNVDVAVLDAGADEHGMTVYDPGRGVVMLAVARTTNPMRQRSSLTHELGHIVFEDHLSARTHHNWSERSQPEIRADAFARHLLVPIEAVVNLVGERPVTESDLSALVQRFEASPAIIAIQLDLAGVIDARTKAAWRAVSAPSLAARHGWTDQYRALQAASNSRRAPQRLLARATDGYVAGVLSLQAIARLRGVSEQIVEEDFAEAGITLQERQIEWSSVDDLGQADIDLSDLD